MKGCTCSRQLGTVLCPQCQTYLAMATGGQPQLPEPESSFQARVRRAALDLGYHFYHTRDSRGSDPDLPDCILLRPGRCFIWELKVNNNKPTQGQLTWISLFNTIPGVRAAVYWPKDWATMLEQLTQR